MKNFKRVLFSLLAAVMVCIIPFGVACKGCKEEDKKPANSVYLANLRIDSSAAKTLYDLGEEFTSEGLVVTAVMSDETEKDVTSSATIDSSAYNKDAVGEYQIGVTYEENSVIKNGTYTVTVEDKVLYDGLVINFADGYSDTAVLDGETTASVDLTKITVKEINEDGTEGGVVTPDSIKVYQGLTEKTATENVVSGLAEGIYQIVVEKPSDRNEGYMRKGMRNFYVVDNLDSLTLAAEAVKTQPAGANTMKATWIFTATFTSGKTQDVTANVTYNPEVNTASVGTKTTVASYKFVNVKDETKTETVSIEYEITAATSVGEKQPDHTLNLEAVQDIVNARKGSGTLVAGIPLEATDFVGENAFLSLVAYDTETESGNNRYRIDTQDSTDSGTIKNRWLEMKGGRFTITLVGTATVTITFNSTGNEKTSNFAILDSAQHAVKATSYHTNNSSATMTEKTEAYVPDQCTHENIANSYELTGGNGRTGTVVYTLEAGTYTLYSYYYYLDSGAEASRGCRLREVDIKGIGGGTTDPGTTSNVAVFSGNSLTPGTSGITDTEWKSTDNASSVMILTKLPQNSKIGNSSSYKQTITLNGVPTEVTNYLDTQGGLQIPKKTETEEFDPQGAFSGCIKLTLTGACKITYYAMSSGDVLTSDVLSDRYIILVDGSNGEIVYNEEGTDKIVNRKSNNTVVNTVVGYDIDVSADMLSSSSTFYLGTKSSGCYIFAIVIEYEN